MRTAMGSYHLRPFGQPCIEGFFGGRFARDLEEAGCGALAAQAIDEIVALLGADYRHKLKPLAKSRWAHDPFARGSYSLTRCPITPARAPCSPHPSDGPTVLRRRGNLAELFLYRAWRKGTRERGRRGS